MFSDVTGVILAGGESKRMGIDKALLQLSGSPLIETTARLFTRLFSETVIISKEAGRFKNLPCREIEDISPEKGAMIGILTGLRQAKTDYIFIAACDMPFLNKKLISFIIERGRGYDVTLPFASGYSHPLHALYSKNCADEMTAAIEKGERGLNRFIKALPQNRVRLISEEEIRSVDPEALSLLNLNTPEELERVRSKLKAIIP